MSLPDAYVAVVKLAPIDQCEDVDGCVNRSWRSRSFPVRARLRPAIALLGADASADGAASWDRTLGANASADGAAYMGTHVGGQRIGGRSRLLIRERTLGANASADGAAATFEPLWEPTLSGDRGNRGDRVVERPHDANKPDCKNLTAHPVSGDCDFGQAEAMCSGPLQPIIRAPSHNSKRPLNKRQRVKLCRLFMCPTVTRS